MCLLRRFFKNLKFKRCHYKPIFTLLSRPEKSNQIFLSFYSPENQLMQQFADPRLNPQASQFQNISHRYANPQSSSPVNATTTSTPQQSATTASQSVISQQNPSSNFISQGSASAAVNPTSSSQNQTGTFPLANLIPMQQQQQQQSQGTNAQPANVATAGTGNTVSNTGPPYFLNGAAQQQGQTNNGQNISAAQTLQ